MNFWFARRANRFDLYVIIPTAGLLIFNGHWFLGIVATVCGGLISNAGEQALERRQ
jgi:hypothetical protein